jgi:hypothetical protein
MGHGILVSRRKAPTHLLLAAQERQEKNHNHNHKTIVIHLPLFSERENLTRTMSVQSPEHARAPRVKLQCASCGDLSFLIDFTEERLKMLQLKNNYWPSDVLSAFFVLYQHYGLKHQPDTQVDLDALLTNAYGCDEAASASLRGAAKILLPIHTGSGKTGHFVLLVIDPSKRIIKVCDSSAMPATLSDKWEPYFQKRYGEGTTFVVTHDPKALKLTDAAGEGEDNDNDNDKDSSNCAAIVCMEAFVVSTDATRRSLVKGTVGGSARRAWVLTKLMKWMVDANTDQIFTPHKMSTWTAEKRPFEVPNFAEIGRNSLGGAWRAEDLNENDTVVSPSASDAAPEESRAKRHKNDLHDKIGSQQKEKELTTTKPDQPKKKRLEFGAPDPSARAGLAEQQQQQQSMETTQQSMETAASPWNWGRNLDGYGCADYVDTDTDEYWAAFDEGVKM